MIINNTKINHLTLYSLDVGSNNPVLIIGNAYGVMPYVTPLAKRFAMSGFTPFWFAFSGQEGTNGKYSYDSCSKDIDDIVCFIANKTNKKLNIVSHCAGGLMTLEYLKRYGSDKINKSIFYGFLFAPYRRRNIAERKLIQSGVKYKLSNNDWHYDVLNALPALNVPALFCHAKDKLNIERGAEDEINLITKTLKASSLQWFDDGYDEDLSNLNDYVTKYVNFLNQE